MHNKMKKLLAILCLSLFTFSSCDDDNKDFVQQNYLVGKWGIIQTGTRTPQGIILYQDYQNNSDCKDNYIFNSDFTFERNDYSIEEPCVSERIMGTYNRLSSNVTLNYIVQVGETNQEQSISFTIISLTYTDVTIAYTDSSNQIVYLKLKKEE